MPPKTVPIHALSCCCCTSKRDDWCTVHIPAATNGKACDCSSIHVVVSLFQCQAMHSCTGQACHLATLAA